QAAPSVHVFLAGQRERVPSTVALNSDHFSEYEICGTVILLSGIATRDHSIRGNCRQDSMHMKAIFSARQRNVTSPQILSAGRNHNDRILIQNVGLHAPPLRTEP